mgnify:CR=1 FL=1
MKTFWNKKEEKTLNLKTDVDLIKNIIELVNKDPNLKVQLITLDGSVLNIWSDKNAVVKDDSMLGY